MLGVCALGLLQTQAKMRSYMEKHCASSCAVAALCSATAEEDEQCVKWATEGYCDHEQFKDYMTRSCPKSCGHFEPQAADPDVSADSPPSLS